MCKFKLCTTCSVSLNVLVLLSIWICVYSLCVFFCAPTTVKQGFVKRCCTFIVFGLSLTDDYPGPNSSYTFFGTAPAFTVSAASKTHRLVPMKLEPFFVVPLDLQVVRLSMTLVVRWYRKPKFIFVTKLVLNLGINVHLRLNF